LLLCVHERDSQHFPARLFLLSPNYTQLSFKLACLAPSQWSRSIVPRNNDIDMRDFKGIKRQKNENFNEGMVFDINTRSLLHIFLDLGFSINQYYLWLEFTQNVCIRLLNNLHWFTGVYLNLICIAPKT
jgi:hypothetical protein